MGEYVIRKLSDVAVWERSKKNKVYPKGCTLLQVSATKGQLVYLHEDQTVDSKYCVIMPKDVNPFYLYRVLEMEMPNYLVKMQTGLNIKPEILEQMNVPIHTSGQLQEYIAQEQYIYEMQIKKVEREIEQLQEFKRWMLGMIFP